MMKNLNFLWLVYFLAIGTVSSAQNNSSSQTIVEPENADKSEALSPKEFLESVLVIRKLGNPSTRSNTRQALEINLVNFNPAKKFLPAYQFNGIEYNDNGKFNDQVAGDGVFTSVTKHLVTNTPSSITKIGSTSNTFKYQNDLNTYKSNNRGPGISFTCKVRTVTCPETSWWNTCWPLSSPCTCIEFYDCEVTVGLE